MHPHMTKRLADARIDELLATAERHRLRQVAIPRRLDRRPRSPVACLMELLGPANWWARRPVRRLHDWRHRGPRPLGPESALSTIAYSHPDGEVHDAHT